MLFKRNAISSLLLELDSDDLPQSRRGFLSDLLAQEVLEFVPQPECARSLINRDKGIIESRGNNPTVYLMNSQLNTRAVLKGFYKSIYYDQVGVKRLLPTLTISELMIMLGTFEIILSSREKEQDSYAKTLKQIKRKTRRKYSYYRNKKNGLQELDELFKQEEHLTSETDNEVAFMNVLDDNMQLLEQAIYDALGLCESEITAKVEDKVSIRSKELAMSYAKINLEAKKRRKEIPTLFDDVLLLEHCGEDTEELQRVYNPRKQQPQFKKRLRQES